MSAADAERFRALAGDRFGFLAARGFRRVPADEHASGVAASLVFAGRHVGFVIALDLRDRQVDVRVVRARDGRIVATGPDGYSRDLVAHLVAHGGYRGGERAAADAARPRGDALAEAVERAARLLREEGAALLDDRPDALPER